MTALPLKKPLPPQMIELLARLAADSDDFGYAFHIRTPKGSK